MRSLVWFRRDLRVNDNSALFHAGRHSKKGVVGLFLIAAEQWLEHHDANCKVKFWIDNVRELSTELGKLKIPLIIRTCDWFQESPQVILKVAQELNCDAIYFNKEYEFNEVQRDRMVVEQCRSNGIESYSYHDRIIVPPQEIKTKQERFYSVFTPYRKVWDTKALEYCKPLPKTSEQEAIGIESSIVPEQIKGFDFSGFRKDLWQPGEREAAKRLRHFATKVANYESARDLPAVNGTSLLSPYLTAGVVSPRQCLAAALEINQNQIRGYAGATTWISELTWRDFYTHVLVGFPRVSKDLPFKLKTDGIPWRCIDDDLEAWKTGNTGYPIVDAGMRQLNQTGWMHNRLRMVTAMFLTKHLMIDWRLGEKFFMQRLVDGDLAANNGGWQWSASTGTDAVPYFRIFNPFSQSKRFDSQGLFIKTFCPELEDLPAKVLHDSTKLEAALLNSGTDYRGFIVDHKFARERVLKAFKNI